MSKVVGARKLANLLSSLDGKLAGYLAATSGIGAVLAQEAQAVVVGNNIVQPFGINGTVNIDFNSDSQIDFQIDHDRYNLNGTDLDYLQIDKNDVNGETDPLPTDGLLDDYPPYVWHQTYPVNSSPHRNNDANVLSFTNDLGDKGGYAVGLEAGDEIGGTGTNAASLIPGALWDWQEGDNFLGQDLYIRANRLIDEDHGQIDAAAGRMVSYPTFGPFGPQPEFPGLDDFTGLATTDVRYLGVRVDLNDAGYANNFISGVNGPPPPSLGTDNAANYWYGWIGIRITNEANATGEVVGYGYETVKGMSILAGDVGTPIGVPGDYNNDTFVDAADYTVWRNNFGTTFNLGGNGNETGGSAGMVDEDDYLWWRQHYGNPGGGAGGGGSAAIPEPGSMVMAAIGGSAMLAVFVAKKFLGGKS